MSIICDLERVFTNSILTTHFVISVSILDLSPKHSSVDWS